MVDVKTEIIINRPQKIVSEYAMNPHNAPKWYVNIKSAAYLPGESGENKDQLSVGSKVAFVAHFMGKKLSYTYEVLEMSDNKFVMKTAQGPFPMETIYEWESISPGATRMRLINRGNPKGFSKLLSPIMSMMMQRANQKDLRRIKQILENNQDL